MKQEISKIFFVSFLLGAYAQPSLALDSDAVDLKIEVRANYRDSDYLSLQTPFPPDTFQKTAEPGDHGELSRVTLLGKIQFTEQLQLLGKLDGVDLYERNPTTSDKEFDIDTLILRYGTRQTNGVLPENITYYGQFGKFGKFERQEDRHIESYGLVSTAFNRLEDSGFEFGVDFPEGFYSKLSYTTGNPVFFRDPNALAGDNGVEFGKHAEKPDYNSGMAVLYDAEVEGLDLSENPEMGVGLGYRWLDAEGTTRVNVLYHYNKRDLAKTIELEGTGYGGDLDLLQVKAEELGLTPTELGAAAGLTIDVPAVGLPINGDKKSESGLTVWVYHKNFAFFSQYVAQEVANLDRDGWEVEMSYLFDEVPLIKSITPALRYSKLRPDFTTSDPYPAMSVTWNWTKVDMGADFEVNDYVNVIVEHSSNVFVRQGRNESYGETLVTLLLSYSF